MTTTKTTAPPQRLYRIWLSYVTADSDAGRKELKQEVIASEAALAIQTVLSRHHGIDVIVATIERVALLDKVLHAEESRSV